MTIIRIALPSTAQPVGALVFATDPLQSPSPLKARIWNPMTKDWDSLTRGMNHIDAQVVLALSLIRWNGPAVSDDGTQLHKIRHMTSSMQDDIRSEVTTALARLRRNKDIRLVGVFFDAADRTNQTQQFRVEYINLRAPKGSTQSITEASA